MLVIPVPTFQVCVATERPFDGREKIRTSIHSLLCRRFSYWSVIAVLIADTFSRLFLPHSFLIESFI